MRSKSSERKGGRGPAGAAPGTLVASGSAAPLPRVDWLCVFLLLQGAGGSRLPGASPLLEFIKTGLLVRPASSSLGEAALLTFKAQ